MEGALAYVNIDEYRTGVISGFAGFTQSIAKLTALKSQFN